MSNNNCSAYYEESSTDDEANNTPSSSASAGSSSFTVTSSLSGSSSAGPSSVGPSSAGPSSAGPSSAGPSSAGPSSAGPSSAGPSSAGVNVGPSSSSGPRVGVVAPLPALGSDVVGQGEREDPGSQHFLNLFTRRDIDRLENWASLSRSLRGTPGFSVPRVPVPNALASFLRTNFGARWEVTLLSPLGELIVLQLRANINGYALLTCFERGQWMRMYSLWSVQERAAQLRRLAEKGGFLHIASQLQEIFFIFVFYMLLYLLLFVSSFSGLHKYIIYQRYIKGIFFVPTRGFWWLETR